MLSVISININPFKFGPTVNAIGNIGTGSSKETSLRPIELSVPWHSVQADTSVFSLLSWHTRISKFSGRTEENEALTAWANDDSAVSVKFIVGEGGVGKSRLAAEFCEVLWQKSWAAGFVNIQRPLSFKMRKAGTLLVVDYPEENIKVVEELLRDLASIGNNVRIRVLFLTRQVLENWQQVIHDSNAANIVNIKPLELTSLNPASANEIYNSALGEAADSLNTTPIPVPPDAMEAWLQMAPENRKGLFVLAAAVHNALHPENLIVEYSGREVVEELVVREVDRLRRIAKDRLQENRSVFARVLALAAVAGELPVEMITNHAQIIGFNPNSDATEELRTAGLLMNGFVAAPRPDILGAAFAVKVFSTAQGKDISDLLWMCLSKDPGGCLARIGRMCHDAEIILNINEHRLSSWLRIVVDGEPDRCQFLEPFLTESWLPLGLKECSIACFRTILASSKDDQEKARLLNNLSNHLSDLGDRPGALDAIKEAVEIRRRLAEANPAAFEPALASSLNNLSRL